MVKAKQASREVVSIYRSHHPAFRSRRETNLERGGYAVRKLDVWTIGSSIAVTSIEIFEAHPLYNWTGTNLLLTQTPEQLGHLKLYCTDDLGRYESGAPKVRLDRALNVRDAKKTDWNGLLKNMPLENCDSVMLLDWHLFEVDTDWLFFVYNDIIKPPIQNLLDVAKTLGTADSELNLLLVFDSNLSRKMGYDPSEGKWVAVNWQFDIEDCNDRNGKLELFGPGLQMFRKKLEETISIKLDRACSVELIGTAQTRLNQKRLYTIVQ